MSTERVTDGAGRPGLSRSQVSDPGNGRNHVEPDTRDVPQRSKLGVTTARDVAEEHLRWEILEGRMRPGERLNEVLIAEELGISRGPVREAVQRLSSEGLLKQVRSRGAFVATVDAGEVRDLYDVRIALEQRALRLFLMRRGEESFDELNRMLDGATAAIEADHGGAYPPDLDFHKAIIRMAGNQVIVRMANEVQGRLQLARSRSARDPRRAAAALTEHREIVQAMIDGDAELASQLLEAHLMRSLENALFRSA